MPAIRDDAFLPGLPVERILASFRKAPGGEVDSGKLFSSESSAALAANAFGLFLEAPQTLPPLLGTEAVSWPAETVCIEHCLRFPWRGGRHPWLDAVITTRSDLIGVESKRYEPFRAQQEGSFSAAYWREYEWGERMRGYQKLRDEISSKQLTYQYLDAVQLIKHALGIKTQAAKLHRRGVLLYLFSEPTAWPNGVPVSKKDLSQHRREASDFAMRTMGSEVIFHSMTYKQLMRLFRSSNDRAVREHASRLRAKFDC